MYTENTKENDSVPSVAILLPHSFHLQISNLYSNISTSIYKYSYFIGIVRSRNSLKKMLLFLQTFRITQKHGMSLKSCVPVIMNVSYGAQAPGSMSGHKLYLHAPLLPFQLFHKPSNPHIQTAPAGACMNSRYVLLTFMFCCYLAQII